MPSALLPGLRSSLAVQTCSLLLLCFGLVWAPLAAACALLRPADAAGGGGAAAAATVAAE